MNKKRGVVVNQTKPNPASALVSPDEAIVYAIEKTAGDTFYYGQKSLSAACLILVDEVLRLRMERDVLKRMAVHKKSTTTVLNIREKNLIDKLVSGNKITVRSIIDGWDRNEVRIRSKTTKDVMKIKSIIKKLGLKLALGYCDSSSYIQPIYGRVAAAIFGSYLSDRTIQKTPSLF